MLNKSCGCTFGCLSISFVSCITVPCYSLQLATKLLIERQPAIPMLTLEIEILYQTWMPVTAT